MMLRESGAKLLFLDLAED